MSDDSPRHDLAVVPHSRTMKVSDGAAGSLIRFLAASRMLVPYEEAIADTWAEVYCKPGPCAHDAFVQGEYETDKTVFQEAVIRFGTKATKLDYGTGNGEIYFFIEFRACLFDDLRGELRKRIQEILLFRPELFSRTHESLPEHAVVGDDETPKDDRLKRDAGGTGRAGTHVEEL